MNREQAIRTVISQQMQIQSEWYGDERDQAYERGREILAALGVARHEIPPLLNPEPWTGRWDEKP